MTSAVLNKMVPRDIRSKGVIAAFIGTLLISFDSIFVRLSGTTGANTVFLFGFFTAISMFTLLQISDPRGIAGTLKEDGLPVFISGLLMFGSASCFILSVTHTSIANTAIIIGSRPVLTAIFSWFFLKEMAEKALWLTMGFVMAGILIVLSGSLESVNLMGDSFAVLAVVFLAINGTFQRRYKKMSRKAVVGIAGLFLAVGMLPFAQISSFSGKTWIIMAIMGLLSAPIGRVLSAVSTRYLQAAEAATISMSMSVFATLWALIIFNEKPPLATLIGGVIIVGSILCYFLFKMKCVKQPVEILSLPKRPFNNQILCEEDK